ncbi:MAG: hypothetical protein UZ12_BCD005001806 [Bacteroidetes bacterium OLB12]|nr:MAG: hypothetical protein UZ12_BCD005001806 [Bacteroidetes bacterium OLB12]HNU42445.1 hypothetical protein [Cyclobacteriaceae bacterium]
MRIPITFILLLVTEFTIAFPCQKYKFDFAEKCTSGNLLISWSYNNGFNRCSDFSKEDISKKQFVVRVVDLSDNVLRVDTITGNTYHLVLAKEEPRLFYVRDIEMAYDEMDIFLGQTNFPRKPISMDSINYFLLGGYLYNAKYVLEEKEFLNQDTIKSLYQELFPEFYPGPKDFFNHYYEPVTRKLLPMPYVSNLSEFMAEVNLLAKLNKVSGKFLAYAKVSENNELIDFEVIPNEYKPHFESAIRKLKFDNKNQSMSSVLLMFSAEKKKYILSNERALMNPSDSKYKKKFRYWGAIH